MHLQPQEIEVKFLKLQFEHLASLVAQMVKNPPAMQETWVQSLAWGDPLGRAWQPTPVFLPGESHGRRSLVGYSSRGCKELDTTELGHNIFLITKDDPQ